MGDHAKQTRYGQQRRDRPEYREEQAGGAGGKERECEMLFQRAKSVERETRIQPLHDFLHSHNRAAGIAAYTSHESRAWPALLKSRAEHDRLRAFSQCAVFAGLYDTDDFEGLQLISLSPGDLASNWILSRPEFFGHGLVDNDDGRGACAIARPKLAALQQTGTH